MKTLNEQAALELAKALQNRLKLSLVDTKPDDWLEATSSNWPIMVPKAFVENAFKVIYINWSKGNGTNLWILLVLNLVQRRQTNNNGGVR